jgi:drug/metabolite transporter (DMT)-like permease
LAIHHPIHRITGILLVCLPATSFGTLAIFGRYAYADGMDAATILFFRFSLAAVVMLLLLAARRGWSPCCCTSIQPSWLFFRRSCCAKGSPVSKGWPWGWRWQERR